MRKKVIIFIFSIIALISGTVYAQQDNYEVHFLDAGQSDCILIKGHSRNYLIDTGASYYTDKILKYLEENKTNKIDTIILTHYHDDHYGGIMKLVEDKKVKNVLLPAHYDEIKCTILKGLLEKRIKVKHIEKGWSIKKGKISLEAIAPLREDSNIENNNSIVIQGEIDGIRYFFAADCEKKEEDDMVKNSLIKKCDILKVPHHSLNTSSTENFINKVDPKIAIVTSNGADTPDVEVIKRLKNRGIVVLRSDVDGNVVVKNEFVKCDKSQLSFRINRNKEH